MKIEITETEGKGFYKLTIVADQPASDLIGKIVDNVDKLDILIKTLLEI